jgi:hypothetical protein
MQITGKVEPHLLAQPPLRADAVGVSDNQHPDQQRRVDRWSTGVAVERCQMRMQLAQIEKPIDPAQQMARRDHRLEIKLVEQMPLPMLLTPNQPDHPQFPSQPSESGPKHAFKPSFSTEFRQERRSDDRRTACFWRFFLT